MSAQFYPYLCMAGRLVGSFAHRNVNVFSKTYQISSSNILRKASRGKSFVTCCTGVRYGGAKTWQKKQHYPMLWMALGLFGFFEKKKEDSELEIIVKRGILAIQEGDPEKAERMFHVGLKMAEDLMDDAAVTFIYDMLANLAMQQGQLEKAETLFKSIISRAINAGRDKEDNAIVEISLKLASIYSMMGDNVKANTGFKFCIDAQEKKLRGMEEMDEDTLLLWAMSVDWYARFLVHQGAYEYAEKYFLKALDVCRTVNGNEHPQTAILLNDLATVCSVMKRADEASKYVEEAISIGSSLDIEELGSFYVNKGLIVLKKGMTKEALESCQRGLRSGKSNKNEEIKEEAKKCIEQVKIVMKELKK